MMEDKKMYEVQNWKHVFKLNPNKYISDEALELLCESKSDAIIISDTKEVELEEVLDLMQRVRRYAIPCVLELSTIDNMSPGFDLYFIPTTLNNHSGELNKFHIDFVKEHGDFIHWDEVLVEGCYEVTKHDSMEEDLQSYAQLNDKMYRFPILHIKDKEELINLDSIKNLTNTMTTSTIFYNGNIVDETSAKQASLIADCIVVENIMYEDIKKALETVRAVK